LSFFAPNEVFINSLDYQACLILYSPLIVAIVFNGMKKLIFAILLLAATNSVCASLITSKTLTVIKTNYTGQYSIGFDINTSSSVDTVQIQRLDLDFSFLGSWYLNARSLSNTAWWAWNNGSRPSVTNDSFGGVYRISLFDSVGALLEQNDNFIDDSIELPLQNAPSLKQTRDGYEVTVDKSRENSVYRHTLDLWDNTDWNRDFYKSNFNDSELLIPRTLVQVGHSYNLYHGIFNYDNQNGVNISYRSTALMQFVSEPFPVPAPPLLSLFAGVLFLFAGKIKAARNTHLFFVKLRNMCSKNINSIAKCCW
jgi:hypothetical protein